jgi:hypothetical protein
VVRRAACLSAVAAVAQRVPCRGCSTYCAPPPPTDCADLLETTRQQCLAGQSRAAQALAKRGALADGLTKASAPDIIYTLMSPQVHQILTAERHWNADQYEHWLARSLAATFLPPTDP